METVTNIERRKEPWAVLTASLEDGYGGQMSRHSADGLHGEINGTGVTKVSHVSGVPLVFSTGSVAKLHSVTHTI